MNKLQFSIQVNENLLSPEITFMITTTLKYQSVHL